MAACSTSIPDCGLTCEELECELNALKANVDNLFGRTDDLNEKTAELEDDIIGQGHGTAVDTYDELIEAVNSIGGTIYVIGEITISQTLSIEIPGTRLIGFNTDTERGKIIFPHSSGADRIIIDVRTYDVHIRNLELTTNHPLTSDESDIDVAINTYGTDIAGWDTSGLVVDNCNIHNVTVGIYHRSGTVANVDYRRRITNNHIHAFCGTGIFLSWAISGALIDNNHVRGRDSGQAHVTDTVDGYGNAIWVGLKATNITISRNICHHVDRHAIELIGGTTDGAYSNRILDNVCEDCWFGISAWGSRSLIIKGNQIERAKDIAMELIGFVSDLAEYIVTSNSIRDTGYRLTTTTNSLAISINGVVSSCLISDNQIGKVVSRPAVGVDAFGIQLYANAGDGGGTDVLNINIRNNVFTDAGSRNIYANSGGGGIYSRYVIENNTFLCTDAYNGLYGSLAAWEAIKLSDVTLAVVKNNTSWYPAAPAKAFGTYTLAGATTVYTGDSVTAPETAVGTFSGTNLRIGY